MNDQDSYLPIKCAACGHVEQKGVDWLRDRLVLDCVACGASIDLREEPQRGEIQRLWNASHHLGPPRRNLP